MFRSGARGLEKLGFWIKAPTGVDSSTHTYFPPEAEDTLKSLKEKGVEGR